MRSPCHPTLAVAAVRSGSRSDRKDEVTVPSPEALSKAPTVVAPCGAVRGLVLDGARVFRAIPYALARRFEAPSSVAPWPGVRDATGLGVIAWQPSIVPAAHLPDLVRWFSGRPLEGQRGDVGDPSEDCLELHVITPSADGKKRPVMVYIHGGGFSDGTSVAATWATRLAVEQDVVVVGVTHRLNVFGFLHLAQLTDRWPDAGNLGLLDLVAGLTWLRDNIAAFGGDPQNVTIFGESGGGMKISALLAMEGAVGLFHKAIIQSGSRLEVLTEDVATAGARRLIDHLGVSVDELDSVPAEALYAAHRSVSLPSGPVMDGRTLNRHPFIPDAPPTANQVPLLVGHTLDEMSMFLVIADEDGLQGLLAVDGEVRDRLLAAYESCFPDLPAERLFARALGDSMFGRAAEIQAGRKASQAAPVYRYVFTYEPDVMGRFLGAFHGADLPLVMRNVGFDEAEGLSRVIAECWANFARNGNPSTEVLPWPKFDATDRWVVLLSDEAAAVRDPFMKVRRAWDGVPPGDIRLILDPRP